MSISNRFFETLKKRADWLEIFYYAERCVFNSSRTLFPLGWTETEKENDREQCRDQAHRLYDLVDEMRRAEKAKETVAICVNGKWQEVPKWGREEQTTLGSFDSEGRDQVSELSESSKAEASSDSL